MNLKLIVDNTIPLKPEETRELDAMIRERQKNVQITYKNVERVYEIITGGLITENNPVYNAIVNRKKISYPLKSAQEIIWDHYFSESEEYSSNEFDDVYQAMAFGLGDVCAHRLKERGAVKETTRIKGEINEYIYGGIKSVYHNPNDLIVEYDFFKEWHEEEPTELKAKALTFFMDMLWIHAYTIKEKENLLNLKKELNLRCSMIKNSQLRASIIKTNTDLIREIQE